jgi:hypothetical protein
MVAVLAGRYRCLGLARVELYDLITFQQPRLVENQYWFAFLAVVFCCSIICCDYNI